MAVYYFATDDLAIVPNEDDTEECEERPIFATLEDACDAAESALREIAAHERGPTLSISVFDENRTVVQRFRLEVTRDNGGVS